MARSINAAIRSGLNCDPPPGTEAMTGGGIGGGGLWIIGGGELGDGVEPVNALLILRNISMREYA